MKFPVRNWLFAASALFAASTAFPQAMTPPADAPRPIAAKDTVFFEQMTWMEVRDALAAGKTTIIIPTGGIEQNGPYLEAGKHQLILEVTAERIARKLGDALVAPIVQFVPEGRIDSPNGHMLYPSTISVSDLTFELLLTDIANSLRVHGFDKILLIGDSGGNQDGLRNVADRLAREWKGETNKFGKSPKIHYIAAYYDNARWNQWVKDQGIKEVGQGIHDDVRHTSLMMANRVDSVRLEERQKAGLATINGVDLLPAEKMVALGNRLADYQADITIAAIKKALRE